MVGGFSDSAVLKALLDALEGAGVGCSVVIAHPDRLEIAYCNQAFVRMSGSRSVEEVVKAHPFAKLPPEEREKLMTLRWAVRRGDASPPPLVATRFTHDDGTVVPIEIGLGYALLGEQRATFCFCRDVTEKTKMETALRESEERFRRLAEVSPDSIAIYRDERCVYANPKAIELFGLQDASELASFEALQLVEPERRPELGELVRRARLGERVPSFVTRRTLANGEDRELEASLKHASIDGEPATLVYTRDITERKQLQAELMKQDRLASLGVLAAGVAHELNNPLALVTLLASKLRARAAQAGGDAGALEDLVQIEEGVHRMTSIIGDLLFLARPSDQPHAHVDLKKVMASSISLLRAGVTSCPPLIEDIGPLPAVRAYPSKLGQVFLNLLRNAVQAIEPGDGEVRVHAHAEKDLVVIRIEDTGVGVPKDVLPRLMTPFFTTKRDGTGLGLWISQAIVVAHGGDMALTSVEGEGTTVTLRLPA